MKREKWNSRMTFILAAIGSAVGLGNAWRFPGLVSKHGGATFLFVYIAAMLILGVPLLMTEISIGRRIRQGVPGSMRALNKKAEPIGWLAVSNAFIIAIYYAVVFAWVILMFIFSYKFAGLTGKPAEAGGVWANLISTTGTTAGYGTFSVKVLVCLLIAWAACYWCIRNGSKSVGKVVKYTVSLPVICLVILAVRGLTMEGAMLGMAKLFIPDWSVLADSTLWVDAIGQVFYSLSVAMAIMFAYGSFLDSKSNIAVDAIIIAVSDLLISVLAAIVMFTTMSGVGMLDKITASGIGTAFIVYPQAIVQLTGIPWLNAAFAYVFYFCLVTLAIDSHFSIVEGVSTAVSDKFNLSKKKTTAILCVIGLVIGLLFCTGAGLAILDIVDNYCNSYMLIIVGVLEAITVGWCFKTGKVLEQINRNTKKFKMPAWLYYASIKFIIPVVLTGLFAWNMVTLVRLKGVYGLGDGYSLTANIVFGWSIILISFLSGLVVRIIVRARAKKGFREDNRTWDEIPEADDTEETDTSVGVTAGSDGANR